MNRHSILKLRQGIRHGHHGITKRRRPYPCSCFSSSSKSPSQLPDSRNVMNDLYSFCVGIMAGGTVGMVGWGGAQVIIPSMTATYTSFPNVAGLSQLAATGISLSSLSLSTITSGYKFYIEDKVDVSTVIAVGLPSMISARYGTKLAKQMTGNTLALFFNTMSIILIPTHFWIQQRRQNKQMEEEEEEESNKSNNDNDNDDNNGGPTTVSKTSKMTTKNEKKLEDTTRDNDVDDNVRPKSFPLPSPLPSLLDYTKYHPLLWQHVTFGISSGIVSALMGVGGLPLTMSYLTEFTNLHHHHIQGTAICALMPSILTSAITRWNVVPLRTASIVAGGAIVGGYVGAQWALLLEETHLRTLYMASLIVFGSRSVIGAIRNIQHLLKR